MNSQNENLKIDLAKTIRMKRLIDFKTGACIICALDHGLTSPVFLSGLYSIKDRTREAINGGANVIMLSRGMLRIVVQEFMPTTSLALMLTASSAGRASGSKVTAIGSVEEALRLGADAVVVYVALTGEDEPEMINYGSLIGEKCERSGMPFIAEAEFPNAYQTIDKSAHEFGKEYLKRNARLCAELGADIIKVNWSGDQSSFEEIIKAVAPRPVVIAGGTLISDSELLNRMEQAREVGAVGCSVGRNMFQHNNPEAIMKAICRIFKDNWTSEVALEELQETTLTLKK